MTQLDTTHAVDRRTNLLVLLLGVPAIISALGITALETWRWVRPNSALFVPPAAASMADAIARDDVWGAYEFIRAGQNPNEVIAVRHEALTGGRRVEVLPLVWAVVTQSDRAVAMLLGFGARLDAPTKHQAVCLAAQLGRDDIVQLLQLSGPDASPGPCPAPRSDGLLFH
jgi:hypothetical protein